MCSETMGVLGMSKHAYLSVFSNLNLCVNMNMFDPHTLRDLDRYGNSHVHVNVSWNHQGFGHEQAYI